jgi:hypothetical protein
LGERTGKMKEFFIIFLAVYFANLSAKGVYNLICRLLLKKTRQEKTEDSSK